MEGWMSSYRIYPNKGRLVLVRTPPKVLTAHHVRTCSVMVVFYVRTGSTYSVNRHESIQIIRISQQKDEIEMNLGNFGYEF